LSGTLQYGSSIDTLKQHFEYNSAGQLIAETGKDYSKTYTYLDKLTILETHIPDYNQRDSIVYDAQNRIQFIGTSSTRGNSTLIYVYDTLGNLIFLKSDTYPDKYFSWEDGDMISDSSSSTSVFKYEYDRSHLSPYQADAFRIDLDPAHASKHLLISYNDNFSGRLNHSYKFDSENRVISERILNPRNPDWWLQIDYSYECQ
jgi:hypothetical protein